MSNDFVNLLERLVNHGVDFVIVGGFAGVVYGCTFVTQDIDICCDFSPSNLLALQRAVSDLDPVHRMTPNRKKLKLTEERSPACIKVVMLYTMRDPVCLNSSALQDIQVLLELI